jgi:SAM-dependent methyltransferase
VLELLKYAVRAVRSSYSSVRIRWNLAGNRDHARRFKDIVGSNAWRGVESVSGRGSDSDQTRELVRVLPGFLRKHEVNSILDIPCGDFHWMSEVDLSGISYLGADIVDELVKKLQARYAGEAREFTRLDLMNDRLPKVDLIFCRDCLVHLSSKDVLKAISRIVDSGSTYLLTTTFPDHKVNREILTGAWRPLNLNLSPYNFPPPAELIIENCTEAGGRFADKSLGLWRVEALRGLSW